MLTQPRRPTRAARSLAVVLATLVAGAGAARAEGPDHPPEPRTPWYGWQILVSDTAAIALWSLAAAADDAKYTSGARQTYETASTALIVSGFATYLLAAPAIHLAHDQDSKALGSLGLRVGLPVAGAMVGAMAASASCNDSQDEVPCPFVGAVLGFVAGGATAMIIDAVFARAAARPPTGSGLQTAVVPSAGGGTLLVAGRF